MDAQRIAAASEKHARAASFLPSYGTAGFRAEASLLDSTVFRCGLLTAARSLALHGKACGLMITASHNPEQDNGVKIVEPDGGMLVPVSPCAQDPLACMAMGCTRYLPPCAHRHLASPMPIQHSQAWEAFATELARASDDREVARLVQRLLDAIDPEAAPPSASHAPAPAVVLLGCDTRPSAARLVAAARAGVEALAGVPTPASQPLVLDLGQVTTPQLHFQVVAFNGAPFASAPPLAGYFDELLGGFAELARAPPLVAAAATASAQGGEEGVSRELHVDCANGVGAAQLQEATRRLEELAAGGGGLRLQLIALNDGGGGLNHRCGADFVQKELVAPSGFEQVSASARCGAAGAGGWQRGLSRGCGPTTKGLHHPGYAETGALQRVCIRLGVTWECRGGGCPISRGGCADRRLTAVRARAPHFLRTLRRCCSVDGDADRLVYFELTSEPSPGAVRCWEGRG